MEAITYRHPTPFEAEAIARVHIETWQTTYKGIVPDDYLKNLHESFDRRKNMWHKLITNSPKSLWIAEHRERIIGFSNFGETRYKEHPFQTEIYALYLLKEFQGKGIGKTLFQKSLQSLKSLNYESLLVWVLKDNPSACFYKKMGGVLISTKEESIGGAILLEEAYGWKSF